MSICFASWPACQSASETDAALGGQKQQKRKHQIELVGQANFLVVVVVVCGLLETDAAEAEAAFECAPTTN